MPRRLARRATSSTRSGTTRGRMSSSSPSEARPTPRWSTGTVRPPPPPTRRRSDPLRASERAADHDPLDLGGPLEQRVDLRVAVPLLDREVLDVAVPAQDLDRLFGDPDRGLAGL